MRSNSARAGTCGRRGSLVCACWMTLTFLALLAAFLELARSRLDAMLAVATITSDVQLNAWGWPRTVFGLWPRGFGATNGFYLNAFISRRPFVCLAFVLMTQLDLCCCGGVLRGLSGGIMMMGFLPVANGLICSSWQYVGHHLRLYAPHPYGVAGRARQTLRWPVHCKRILFR